MKMEATGYFESLVTPARLHGLARRNPQYKIFTSQETSWFMKTAIEDSGNGRDVWGCE
jgi:hypothetical protein